MFVFLVVVMVVVVLLMAVVGTNLLRVALVLGRIASILLFALVYCIHICDSIVSDDCW